MDYWDNKDLLHSFANVKSISIQTIDYCHRKCAWCPNSHMEKSKDSLMSWETLNRVLDEIEYVKFDGRIHLYLLEEPLCDDRIVDIIALVKKRFPTNTIYISTNGDYLDTKIKVRDLFEAGLSELSVMMYDDLNTEKLIKYSADPRIALIKKEEMNDCWYNRAGHINVKCDFPVEVCEWLFHKLYITRKGELIVCCSDYDYEVVYGNLMDQGLMDIWLSPKYKLYRIAHFFKHGQVLPLCDKCNRLKPKEVLPNGRVRKRWPFFRSSSQV